MCTVVVEVRAGLPTRLLAVRDEDPKRAWDGPGEWWPSSHPGVRGVRDRRANGAWLAMGRDPAGLAVILNRAPAHGALSETTIPLESRGGIVLNAVDGGSLPERPNTGPFNLVNVSVESVTLTSWDGATLHQQTLTPGVHMVAHHLLDDPGTARIRRWLPEFAAASAELRSAELRSTELRSTEDWRERWLDVLDRSVQLGPNDDRAIIRDNTVHGYPTLSLLVCIAEIGVDGTVKLESAPLDPPGHWDSPAFLPS